MLLAASAAALGLVLPTALPTYFTCRHTYESVLQEELVTSHALAVEDCSSPLPGLVRVERSPAGLDPVYALQALPGAIEVSGASVKSLAAALVAALLASSDVDALRSAPRGALAVHELVPAMLRGVSPTGRTKPALSRRCAAVAEAAGEQLRGQFACARPLRASDPEPEQRWLLQLLMLEPEELVASVCRITPVPVVGGSWPCAYPAGLAAGSSRRYDAVAACETMPSSAYRKLLEALACCGEEPSPTSTVFDLGASPGGWTAALRQIGCGVVAVDRSPLSKELMADGQVTFVQGDAFTFEPAEAQAGGWMVSDIIAYPERVTELLERWGGSGWAERMVLTMKFQGERPSWEALDTAMAAAAELGYACRAKHFFSNKNEITLMLARRAAGARPEP